MFSPTIFILCVLASVHGLEEAVKVETTTDKSTNNGFEFPTKCGYSPIYPRELMDGGYKIEPDEFSWLASLEYANQTFGHCSGSVISSRYVLTSGNCVVSNRNERNPLGKPIRVRLGKYTGDEICDYGTESCKDYDFFNIEHITPHSDLTLIGKQTDNIALIRLDRDIVFGPKMQPVCLPFGKNKIDAPEDGSFLTVAGWWTTLFPSDVVAKRSEAVAFWNTTGCQEADLDKNTQYCGVKPGQSPCTTESGSALMNMFERRRMVLEGIAYSKTSHCPGTDVGTLYTQVRPYGKWIEQAIKELENPNPNPVEV